MNFDLNDEQREIQSTAKEFLADRFKPAKVRELAEARSYDDGLWKQISELGWPGIAIAEDDGFLEGFLAGAAIIVATAAIIYLTGGVALLVAAGGAAAGLVIWTPIMAGIGKDDLIGRTTLVVTPVAIDQRIGATHAADFLSAGTALRALPKLDGAPTEHERADPRLIHPFVDFKLGPPLPAECDPGMCPAGKTCLVNRCVDPGFVDPTAGRGFRERREYVGSGGYYGVDLLWEKRQVP